MSLPSQVPFPRRCSCPSCTSADPLPAGLGRRADPRVVGNTAVAQGVHVRPILVDPCAHLIGSADGPVAGDDDIDVARHALEQPQRGEVVLDRVGGVQVEHRDQDVGEHVAGDENPAFLDQQRRMARGVRLMLDDPDLAGRPTGSAPSPAGRPVMRPNRSSGTCSAMSVGTSARRRRPSSPGPTAVPGRRPRSGPCRSGAPRRARRARAGDPSADASRSLPRRSGPTGQVVREAGHLVVRAPRGR